MTDVYAHVEIKNIKGLHARAAAAFVKIADGFIGTDISVSKNGQEVSGKSILGLMTLAASKGTVITIKTEGAEAKKALDDLVGLVNEKFNED
ncbi:MAG: Phosphocarrier protein HPr [Alphaproteobacteria bacterium ADurb.Bin438]|nr:MAG: Phosphocarrier protein HPr [Alphaproteobacteria bacterium ADurb.Bin438]